MDETSEVIERGHRQALRRKEQQSLALKDDLTDLYNRRFYNELFRKEFAEAKRYKKSLSLIQIDFDLLKEVNDTWGHLVGDAVLKETAEIIKENVRESDVACRFTGDEFVIISPETEAGEALKLAERIREEIKEEAAKAVVAKGVVKKKREEFLTRGITVSGGVAGLDDSMEKADDLYNAADQATYAAKEAGRNSVQVWKGNDSKQKR